VGRGPAMEKNGTLAAFFSRIFSLYFFFLPPYTHETEIARFHDIFRTVPDACTGYRTGRLLMYNNMAKRRPQVLYYTRTRTYITRNYIF